MKTQSRHSLIGLLSLVLLAPLGAGCASHPATAQSDSAPANDAAKPFLSYEAWPYRGQIARTARTPHYAIHTTVTDEDFLEKLANLMEGALAQYQQFTPGVKLTADPMECYLFARRAEWAEFTSAKTGTDAALYLQINRGGYTVRDWYVAYHIGDVGTYAVAAHEGFHQYVARHFRSRMPPFLEEGIATMFENVHYYGAAPTWDLSPSSNRAVKLRRAIDSRNLWPLDKLITMHAGEVVSLPGPKIEAFYAQNWAFAQFLWDAEDGKYRPALQRLLSDCAAGSLYQGSDSKRRAAFDSWDPSTVQPMLEHYLCMNLTDIDKAYQAYCRKIAYAGRSAWDRD